MLHRSIEPTAYTRLSFDEEGIGRELLIVSLDFEERVIRMGYGDMGAVRMLHDVNILIYHVPGLQVIIGLTVIVQ